MFCLLTKYRSGAFNELLYHLFCKGLIYCRGLKDLGRLWCLHSYWLQWQQHVGGSRLSGNDLHVLSWCRGLHEGPAAVSSRAGGFSLGEGSSSDDLVHVWLSAVLFHGFLVCCDLRLAGTKASVTAALADDFDTPRAISAIMNLVYHGNCQLQPVSKVTHRLLHSISIAWLKVPDECRRHASDSLTFYALTNKVCTGNRDFAVFLFSLSEHLRVRQCLEPWWATSERSWTCSGSICCTSRSGHNRNRIYRILQHCPSVKHMYDDDELLTMLGRLNTSGRIRLTSLLYVLMVWMGK